METETEIMDKGEQMEQVDSGYKDGGDGMENKMEQKK
jgi:hypothetical protein